MAKRETPRKEELIARITTLRAEGKSWADVTSIITRDGFTDASGEAYNKGTLTASYARWTKPKAVKPKKSEDATPPESMTSKSEKSATIEPTPNPDESPKAGEQPPRGRSEQPTSDDTPALPTSKSEQDPAEKESDHRQETTDPAPGVTTGDENLLTEELRGMITEFLQCELVRILTDIHADPVQRPGRGKKGVSQVTKKSFSFPTDLWTEFEKRFQGEKTIMSNHVAAALRAYLNLMSPEKGEE